MRSNASVVGMLLISIVFAGLILGTSYFLKDAQYAETVKFFLIAIWWVPFSYLCGRSTRKCC